MYEIETGSFDKTIRISKLVQKIEFANVGYFN